MPWGAALPSKWRRIGDKERVKIAHAEQVIVACSRLCVSKQLFFHVSLYQKLWPSPRVLSSCTQGVSV